MLSSPLMHQYQQGEDGEPVKVQECRIFLQTNIVRSSDTNKMHFSYCWLTLRQVQSNILSLTLENNILQTGI